jgi:hypothetical protein
MWTLSFLVVFLGAITTSAEIDKKKYAHSSSLPYSPSNESKTSEQHTAINSIHPLNHPDCSHTFILIFFIFCPHLGTDDHPMISPMWEIHDKGRRQEGWQDTIFNCVSVTCYMSIMSWLGYLDGTHTRTFSSHLLSRWSFYACVMYVYACVWKELLDWRE